jgi:hypothetical protein
VGVTERKAATQYIKKLPLTINTVPKWEESEVSVTRRAQAEAAGLLVKNVI